MAKKKITEKKTGKSFLELWKETPILRKYTDEYGKPRSGLSPDDKMKAKELIREYGDL